MTRSSKAHELENAPKEVGDAILANVRTKFVFTKQERINNLKVYISARNQAILEATKQKANAARKLHILLSESI